VVFEEAQHVVGVGGVAVGVARELGVALGEGNGFLARIDRMHQFGPGFQRVHRKAARVAERVEHAAAGRVPRQQGPVVALVDKKACFLARFPINGELVAVFGHEVLGPGALAKQVAVHGVGHGVAGHGFGALVVDSP